MDKIKNYKDNRNYDNLQRRVKKLIYTKNYYYFDNIGKLIIYNPYDNIFNLRHTLLYLLEKRLL